MHDVTCPSPASADQAPDFPVIFVTGLSGAGKSTVLNVFEDMHFFTMDGLPANVLVAVTEALTKESLGEFRGLVIGVNLLHPSAVSLYNEALVELNKRGIFPGVLFVEAKPPVIIQRYATTRRPHPLESEGLGLEQALEEENKRLALIREKAELVLDTSSYSIHDLRRAIQKKWATLQEKSRALKVHLISFGFKYGTPAEADMVYDLRFLPNPYFIPELKPMSGLDAPVADFLLREDPGMSFVAKLTDFLLYLLPLFESEGRYRITIAVGCTGGRHRSVAVTQALAEALKQCDFSITTEHRHLELG
ncbi:RNase adapter RapZ [Desulfovibrio sp. OttesenSCG-928-O18]|nr:RNase adapter RapZ [Desulfovibrio sp. OttesenSCG-928-O18]